MDITSIENLVPDKYKWLVLASAIIIPMAGRAYHAIRSGGGIKGIWNGLIYGTNSLQTPQQTLTTSNEKITPKP
jgi:hypothetical protein